MKRKDWCEFDKATRECIKERDRNCCIYCKNTNSLQIAHVFISRAQGGKGAKENGVLLCLKCHMILDNYIGIKQKKQAEKIKKYCENYLLKKENVDIDKLRYKKYN